MEGGASVAHSAACPLQPPTHLAGFVLLGAGKQQGGQWKQLPLPTPTDFLKEGQGWE